jgi:pilus assembly protein CpaC
MTFTLLPSTRKTLASMSLAAALLATSSSLAFANTGVNVPVNRSTLVVMPSTVKEVLVSDPSIADVHVHNGTSLSIIGKAPGSTNVRIFGENGKVLRNFDIDVGYDLPSIRKSLKTLIPDESIGVEMVNTSIALTGQVRNAAVAEKALKIVQDFIGENKSSMASSSASSKDENPNPKIVNLLRITSGQQVMLRVRVGEVNRDALKRLNIDPSVVLSGSGNFFFKGATGTGIEGLTGSITGPSGAFTLPTAGNVRGTLIPTWTDGNSSVRAQLQALERDGLFRLLAEPNLVAISGEQAEFLAGGEIPVPVAQGSTTGAATSAVTVEYKPYGVSVKFTPDVLSESRVRIKVQPEVSDVTFASGAVVGGLPIPAVSTRRAKTTVELAPGESFMIAGLIKDQTRSQIDQMPMVKELPILGALFRSTEFQRNETELVIAVTPYIVDPVKSSDVKLPTDDFRPASNFEMFFFGALGANTSDGKSVTHVVKFPSLEGPTGFMVD